MDFQLRKIRRLFAGQLTHKHKLKLDFPDNDDDSSESTIEYLFEQMTKQLHEKLSQQDQQLIHEKNSNSPLVIQRRQLKKDIDDFLVLNQRQDVRKIQQIIDRVEHMAMFNTKSTIRLVTQPAPSIVISTRICSYQVLCKELVDRLHWPLELFAPEYDRCFCKNCYPITMPNVYQTNPGNQYPVVIPRNWMKFGLKVDEVQAKIHQIWDKWAISYHGTLPKAALSMVKHRQICLPGDILSDGTQLSIRTGHIPNENAFFTSPTIRYACQNHYSTPLEFTSQIDKCLYTAKLVLRCRQMPSTFSIQHQTLNNNSNSSSDICDVIPDEQIEWRTDQRGTVIFDGLCIRLKQSTTFDRQQN